MNDLFIRLGSIKLRLESDFDIELDDEIKKFLANRFDKEDVVCNIKRGVFKLPEKAVLECEEYVSVYSDGKSIYRPFLYSADNGNATAVLLRNTEYDNNYQLWTGADNTRFKFKSIHLPLEEILAYHRGILLHSSYIVHNGEAILFSAPSGTGKTTQAELWKKYVGADIVNGDRCAVMKIDGRWCACGCFYKGSSSYCENLTAPIKAIITLEQGDKNCSYTLNEMEKFKALYRESLVHTWNEEYVELLVDTIMECAKEIRMEHFACLPDESAVRYVENLIYNN